MKRFSSGKGRIQQPGLLKPRNGDLTPNNRQSVGQSGRRSFVQKVGQADSAKRVYNRVMRGSTENAVRSTLVSSRFTPTRTNSAGWVPQSTNRMSTDSARSSGIGLSSRKDTRPIADPAYKTQCVNKILDFLRNGYPYSLERRTLLTPSTRDFTNIFIFIYKHLDPSYVLPARYEEEIPKLLKKLNYPVQMTKSSFVTVGSPHTWPAVLAMLVFLVDMVNFYNILSQDLASPFDLDAEDVSTSITSLARSAYKCSDEEELRASLEVYCENLKAEENASERDLEELQDEIEASERILEALPNSAEELKQLQQCYTQCSDDLRKLVSYCQELKMAIEMKEGKLKNTEQILTELGEREIMIRDEVDCLKKLQEQQSFSKADLNRLKNHSQEIGREIEQHECLGGELQSQVWHAELEISKIQPIIKSSFAHCVDLLGKLEISGFSDILASYEEVNQHFDAIIAKIKASKKVAKKSTSHAQKKIWELDQEISKAKGVLQDKQTESKKLDTKIRHSEEEFHVAQEEIEQEERVRLEETEVLHQQIMVARKTYKKSLYELQRMKEDKKREFEGYKKKEETSLIDGAHFLMKICQEALQSLNHRDSMTAEYISHINIECNQFRQWLKTGL